MPVRIEVLGPVRAWRDNTEIPLGAPQQRAVLALLAVAGGRPVPVPDIIEALWRTNSPSSAANIVQTYLKRLRRLLDPDRPARSPGLLPRVGDGYALQADQDAVDLWRFRALTSEAREARRAADHDRVVAVLTEALGLWTGRPLSDVPVVADHLRLVTLESERWTAVNWFAEAALLSGSATEALSVVEDAAVARPLDERVHAHLIRIYHTVGRRSDGIRIYHEIRRRLSEELGLDPGPELMAAYSALLRDERPRAAASVPAPVSVPAQLPAGIRDFAGRAEQVEEVLAALDSSKNEERPRAPRVVVVTGMGGIGKTTLAVHVGHRLTERFPDGQLYANLGSQSSETARADEVLGMFLFALGVDGSAIPENLDDRAALYRSRLAGRRLLVVLDNAADEAQVRPLLPGTHACTVLVTSRSRLAGLESSVSVELGALAPRHSAELLGRIAGSERIAAEPAAADEIARLCGHVPLAIRIAGVRLATRPHLKLARFAERLRDEHRRLDQLVVGDLAVRASLALSYSHLPEPARRAFRALGLLTAPDFACWTVAALIGQSLPEAEAVVDALVDAHLLNIMGTDATGQIRFRFHDLVRVYARELADREENAESRHAALSRAFRTWLVLAEEADRRLTYRCLLHSADDTLRPPEPPEFMDDLLADPSAWFESERAGIVHAVRQAREDDAAVAWNLADASIGFYEMRDIRDDWRSTHEHALSACRSTKDQRGEAVLSRNLAYLEARYGVNAEPLGRHSGHALSRFRVVSDRAGEAEALLLLGVAMIAMGRPGDAVRYMNAALELARECRHLSGEIVATASLGWLYREQSRYSESAELLRRCLELAGEDTNGWPQSTAWRSLGMIYHYQGRLEESERCLRRALTLARASGARGREALELVVLGEHYIARGRPEGEELLRRSLALSEESGSEFARAVAIRAFGELDLAKGRFDRAVTRITEALESLQAQRATLAMALTLKRLGSAQWAAGDTAAAHDAWRSARAVYEVIDNQVEVVELTGWLTQGPSPAS
ncbi:BTAD domain-containing putative transcriptional regulator [Streptosporangium sp. NPDC000396]|uniref:AfsR/SARP family transcriptional regulator n=1 Tax=Streptosporangium sp. NPDC000396 TaxID=3366185 RepID=UPI00369E2D4E